MNRDCLFPFSHLYIEPRGVVSPCCGFYKKDGDYLIQSAEDLDAWYSNPELEDIRNHFRTHRDMMNPECGQCINHERFGSESMRTGILDRIGEHKVIEFYKKPKITSMHIKFGNLCNLACRTCSEESSSLLEREFPVTYVTNRNTSGQIRFGDLSWYARPGVFEKLITMTDDLDTFHASGGEPLVNDYFWKFIEHLYETGKSKNIMLALNTNGTVTLKPKQIEMLKGFKSISCFDVSQDATEELAEYIRTRSSWDLWKRNLFQYRDMIRSKMWDLQTQVRIVITISAYNVHKLRPLVDFANENNFEWFYQFVHWPEHLAVDNLNKPAKDFLIEMYEHDSELSFIAEYVKNSQPRELNGLSVTQYMDNRDFKAKELYKNFKSFKEIEPEWYSICQQK